jgi:beta-lactamase class C
MGFAGSQSIRFATRLLVLWAKHHIMLVAILCTTLAWPVGAHAATRQKDRVGEVVHQIIAPLMTENVIPGMEVGIIINGHDYVYDYGLASVAPKRPVTGDTLFEIGSISKTFTATLAEYAQLQGDLSLTCMASTYLPALRGTAFDKVSLVDLGTYTPGGMPLQVPDGINNNAQLMAYFKSWKPAHPPGTVRTYANPSIGLLGLITAASMKADFSLLAQTKMFPALGLTHSFMDIPANEMANYAQGYDDDGTPIRMTEGMLGPEAYGVRTNAADLLRFLAINMGIVSIDPSWQRAVTATHTGYDQLKAGGMVQDLVWEQYALPVTLAALHAGNSAAVLLNPNSVTALNPPSPPRAQVLLNKTGSTNGFGAYVAFIPADRIGIVLLANKSYPIPARVAAAYAILSRLGAAGLVWGQPQ